MSENPVCALSAYHKETSILNQIVSLLNYDQDVALPPKGVNFRSEQVAYAVRLLHERKASPVFQDLITKAAKVAKNPIEKRKVELARRLAHHATCMPADFAAQEAADNTLNNQAWGLAKAQNDFGRFLPHLQKAIENARKRASYLRYCPNDYDTLLYSINHGIGMDQLNPLFAKVSSFLAKFAEEHKVAQDTDIYIPLKCQEQMCQEVAASVGLTPEWSVMAVARHPSSNNLGPGDIRITTRYDQKNGLSSFFATLHESGHALYDFGSMESLPDNFLNENNSMGLHESQSLFLENHVGRSIAFLKKWYLRFKNAYPALDLSENEWIKRVTAVKQSTIRVAADEVTYCLHVVIRYELERDMILGGLQAKDVPHRWNRLYEKYLNITPQDDRSGCLQDIHWSAGLFGYFPSYAIGHLIAAQLRKKIEQDLGFIEDFVQKDRIADLIAWLRRNIHARGRTADPLDILRDVCGENLSADDFCLYLKEKRRRIAEVVS